MNSTNDKTDEENSYLLPTSKIKAVLTPLEADKKPLTTQQSPTDSDRAANVIRDKIHSLYGKEPNAKEELVEARQSGVKHSKHQQFMLELSNSGKSLPEIQTQWHEYYNKLPDTEKHEVWNEFYSAHAAAKEIQHSTTPAVTTGNPSARTAAPGHTTSGMVSPSDTRSIADIKSQIVDRVRRRGKLKPKQHFQSVIFGLAMGAVVLLILLFGFFNERFVAPFITPSRNVSATPIIIDPNVTAVGPETKVIIPKINVEIPVVYDVPTIEEKDIQQSLERGVVHYATSPTPGQSGNSVIVGHSSNNILNKGKYKFAFVLLSRLDNGDTFYLTKDGKRYAYRVYEKRIIKPTDVSVLGGNDRPATATLITCDPPGTSINRLVVVGEQISPDPVSNTASTVTPVTAQASSVPGNAPSLWERIKGWFTG